ncbi:unnamed protein product [Hymenolepis diminuta]|uniref:Band_3_cyto domain-containing protein n=1 Tax=Hymenolepis diminuta TaxID=6216 RepID=A0A158QDK0_HYMDI|nr:unnamed protein product [Hymenolepis diminuta]
MFAFVIYYLRPHVNYHFASILSRWIKYEEEVEESADRWSKPHVAVQPLMSVFEVRSCLAKAVMLLDLEVTSLELVADEVVQRMVKKKMLDSSLRDQTRDLLLLHHSTLYTRQKRRVKTGQQLHIIRSLAEIGKRHSAKDVNKLSHVPSHSIVKSATNLGVDRMDPQTAATSANDQHTPDNIESTQVPITFPETTEIQLNDIHIKRKIMSPYR